MSIYKQKKNYPKKFKVNGKIIIKHLKLEEKMIMKLYKI